MSSSAVTLTERCKGAFDCLVSGDQRIEFIDIEMLGERQIIRIMVASLKGDFSNIPLLIEGMPVQISAAKNSHLRRRPLSPVHA